MCESALKLPNFKCNNNPLRSYSVAHQGKKKKKDGRTERYNQTYSSVTTVALYMEVCLAVCLLPSNGVQLVGRFPFNSRRETLNKSCRAVSISNHIDPQQRPLSLMSHRDRKHQINLMNRHERRLEFCP